MRYCTVKILSVSLHHISYQSGIEILTPAVTITHHRLLKWFPMPIYRIFIVDDRPINVSGLKERLSIFPSVEVIGTAFNGEDYLRKIGALDAAECPDVVLMDIEMPVMNGIATLHAAVARYPNIRYIMLTVFEDDAKIFESIQAGAMGYLLKDEPTERIIAAITEIMELGGAPMSPVIARKALRLLSAAPTPKPETIENDLVSKREISILRLMANGDDYREIAATLFISPQTVRTHITNIYKKLQVNSKTAAISVATKKRWL
jgi:DNA-binding NarL/FixJ family response regulator